MRPAVQGMVKLKCIVLHVLLERLQLHQQKFLSAGLIERCTYLLAQVCRRDQAQYIISARLHPREFAQAVHKRLLKFMAGVPRDLPVALHQTTNPSVNKSLARYKASFHITCTLHTEFLCA